MHLTARFPGLFHPLGFNIEIPQARILLHLIEQFDCVAMGLSLRRKLFSFAFDQPWELLHLACDCDDIELGRHPRLVSEAIAGLRRIKSIYDRLDQSFEAERFLAIGIPEIAHARLSNGRLRIDRRPRHQHSYLEQDLQPE
jgi:hypothetical protein